MIITKQYVTCGVCVCTLDDEEFYPSNDDSLDGGYQYSKHLKQLGITQ